MAPLPLGAHLAQLVFHAGPHPAQVDRDDPVEDVGRFVGGVARWNLDAGIVEGEVEPAEGFDGRLHHGRHTVLLGDVTPNTEDPVAGGCQLVCGGP
jgi:hypothetical protein